MSSPDMTERLDDLEIRLAFQDKLIRELDTLVKTFGDRLDEAQREIAALKQALQSPEPALGPGNEPPPHY